MRIEGSNPTITPSISSTQTPQLDLNQGPDFGEMLMDVLKEVNANQQKSRGMQNDYMTGQPVEIHDLMIAMEQASVSMQLTMTVRNKLLEAYQEVARMQV